MIFVVPKAKLDAAQRALKRAGEKPWVIGEIIQQRRGKGRVEYRVERCALGILISGRGSNFEAIAISIARRKLDAEIAIVISNRASAPGLEIARERGIPVRVIASRGWNARPTTSCWWKNCELMKWNWSVWPASCGC